MTNLEENSLLIIKFIDEEYVDSFVNEGLLYMNNIQYFRDYEDSNPALRGDQFEGLSASYKPDHIVLNVDGHEIEGIVGKIDFRENHQNETNIYSMTMITAKDISDAGENGLILSSDFNEFGNKALCILNINEFFDRVQKAVSNNINVSWHENNQVFGQKVEYLNRKQHDGELTIFNKFSKYLWQYEFRIALKQTEKKGPFELRIGSLADIVHVFDTDSLVRQPIKSQPKGL